MIHVITRVDAFTYKIITCMQSTGRCMHIITLIDVTLKLIKNWGVDWDCYLQVYKLSSRSPSLNETCKMLILRHFLSNKTNSFFETPLVQINGERNKTCLSSSKLSDNCQSLLLQIYEHIFFLPFSKNYEHTVS